MEAKIEAYFGGLISRHEFESQLIGVNHLSLELTGRDFLREEDYRTFRNYLFRKSGYQEFQDRTAQVCLELYASYYEPNPNFNFPRFGYGIEVKLRGTKEGVKRGFGCAIDRLGFPLRVELPTIPIPYLDDCIANLSKYTQGLTNFSGWRIARKVVQEKGAELKKMNQSICRFPFNLFLIDSEGKIVKDGRVIDEKWNSNHLQSAVNSGQVESIITID